jgi:glycosyltransferase involved in cell wall biosynthesis
VRQLAGPHVEVIADAPSVRPHLETACVVLAPVRTGGGMRMKILYALASGKPVVTTSRGAEGYSGPRRIAPLAVADDAESIATLTAELLGDRHRRRALGEWGRAFALEHHSPAAWATRLENVYHEARNGMELRRG